MSAPRRLAFWSLVALQALVPLGLIGWNEAKLALGDEVRLKTAPVDPYDLFRGRYVTLRYEISSVPGAREVQPGDTVYVSLRDTGDRWRATGRAQLERPGAGTFIRGRMTQAGIVFGIETYYADEAEALALEEETGAEGLYVDVVLDGEGDAQIAGIEAVR
jgi:uncharacterized membrane-anchored protein